MRGSAVTVFGSIEFNNDVSSRGLTQHRFNKYLPKRCQRSLSNYVHSMSKPRLTCAGGMKCWRTPS